MRHMLCVGFSIPVFGSRHSNRREPSNWCVACSKHARFIGLALLVVVLASSKYSAKHIHLLAIVYDIAE